MAFLTKIGFENFRILKDKTNIDLKGITILTGTNSSGKSSVCKGLVLLQKAINEKNSLIDLKFNNDSTMLGDMASVMNDVDRGLKFFLPIYWFGLDRPMTMKLSYIINERGEGKNGVLDELVIKDDASDSIIMTFARDLDKDGKQLRRANITGFQDELGYYSRKVNLKFIRREFNNVFSDYRKMLSILGSVKELLGNRPLILPRFESIPDDLEGESIEKIKTLIAEIYKLDKQFEIEDPHQMPDIMNVPCFDSIYSYYKPLFRIKEARFSEGMGLFGGIKHSLSKTDTKVLIERDKMLRNTYNENLPIYNYTYLNNDNIEYYNDDIAYIEDVECEIFEKVNGRIFANQVVINDTSSLWLFDSFNDKSIELLFNKLHQDLDYQLSQGDITQGDNYTIFDDFICQSIDSLLDDLSVVFNSSNLNLIPSVRSLPKRIIQRQDKGTYFEDILNQISEVDNLSSHKDFLNKWLVEFEIAEGIDIQPIEGSDYCAVKIMIDGELRNLADVGYGYSQLLPLLLKVSLLNTKILIVEEPETNLHPALQSKLADFFVAAREKFGTQFIIESHSEYLIRRMQYLVATKKITSDNVNLYYFNKPNRVADGDKQVYEIEFLENGLLSDAFGPGFTDESDRLALDLYRLNQGQSN